MLMFFTKHNVYTKQKKNIPTKILNGSIRLQQRNAGYEYF